MTKKTGPKKTNAIKPKMTAADRRLIQATKEMAAHMRGEIELTSYTPPQEVDVSKIRKELGYSQTEFAGHFGFAVSALRDWEQGRRNPERTARILLTLIAANPKMVEQTLAQI